MPTLIVYGKPGCHLCEGLQEKLTQLQRQGWQVQMEFRDITTRPDWFAAYEYEIPVLFYRSDGSHPIESPIPRPSPRLTAVQLQQFLHPYLVSPIG